MTTPHRLVVTTNTPTLSRTIYASCRVRSHITLGNDYDTIMATADCWCVFRSNPPPIPIANRPPVPIEICQAF